MITRLSVCLGAATHSATKFIPFPAPPLSPLQIPHCLCLLCGIPHQPSGRCRCLRPLPCTAPVVHPSFKRPDPCRNVRSPRVHVSTYCFPLLCSAPVHCHPCSNSRPILLCCRTTHLLPVSAFCCTCPLLVAAPPFAGVHRPHEHLLLWPDTACVLVSAVWKEKGRGGHK